MRHLKPAILICLVLAAACKKTTPPETPDLGYNYYPNDVGHYRIYQVEDIRYNDFTETVDTVEYQLKETFTEAFEDSEGRESRRLERYTRDTDTSKWELKDVWTSTKTEVRVEQVEENQRIVKLIFPPAEARTWNGNAMNGMPEEEFEVVAVRPDTVVGNSSIPGLVTVEHYREKNFIEEKVSLEKFGKGVGLVHRYYVNLNLQKDSGIIRTMWITEYGE